MCSIKRFGRHDGSDRVRDLLASFVVRTCRVSRDDRFGVGGPLTGYDPAPNADSGEVLTHPRWTGGSRAGINLFVLVDTHRTEGV